MAEQVDIKGIPQVIENLSTYGKNVIKEVISACEAVQASVINDAHKRVPFVTGNLYKSIQAAGIKITNDNVSAIVMANAEYASYVEGVADAQGRYGRGKKTPFLIPALLQNINTFRKAVMAACKRASAR